MIGVIAASVYIVLLTVVIVCDLRYRVIPNKVVYPGLAIALACSWFNIGIISLSIGAVVMLVIIGLLPRMFRIKVGMGDVKLGILIGLMVGYPLIVVNMFIIGIASILLGIFVLFVKHWKSTDMMPFGAIMAIACILTILFGGDIWLLVISLYS